MNTSVNFLKCNPSRRNDLITELIPMNLAGISYLPQHQQSAVFINMILNNFPPETSEEINEFLDDPANSSNEQLSWLTSQSPSLITDMSNHMAASCSPNNTNYINNIVTQMMDNVIGEVDIPNKVIIEKTLSDNPCLNGVYNQMGKAPAFQNFIKNFSSEFSVADLTFSAGIPFNPGAHATTLPPVNGVIKIIFNTNQLNRPRLEIARTFIHEIIHADIYRKLLACANISHVNHLNLNPEQWKIFVDDLKNNFFDLYEYYMRYNYPLPAGTLVHGLPQHDLMAERYRNVISDALRQFDNNANSQAVYDALAWEGLMGTGNNPTSTVGLPLNPSVAWANTPVADRLQILNTISNFTSSNPPCQ